MSPTERCCKFPTLHTFSELLRCTANMHKKKSANLSRREHTFIIQRGVGWFNIHGPWCLCFVLFVLHELHNEIPELANHLRFHSTSNQLEASNLQLQEPLPHWCWFHKWSSPPAETWLANKKNNTPTCSPWSPTADQNWKTKNIQCQGNLQSCFSQWWRFLLEAGNGLPWWCLRQTCWSWPAQWIQLNRDWLLRAAEILNPVEVTTDRGECAEFGFVLFV